jgi:hypothetical protein
MHYCIGLFRCACTYFLTPPSAPEFGSPINLENRMKLRAKRNSLAKAQQPRSWSLFERGVRAPRLASNIEFAKGLGAQLTKTLAMKLSQLNPGIYFNDLAGQIQFHFVCQSIEAIEGISFDDAHKRLECVWLSTKDRDTKIRPKLDPIEFTHRMTALQLPTSSIDCPVARNLTWLAESLKLTVVEQKILQFAYSLNSRIECVHPVALSNIRYETMSDAMKCLSIIFDTTVAEIVKCYAGPSLLYGLQLIGQEKPGNFVTLDELLNMPQFTVQLLETEYANASDLLTAIMQPEFHADVMPDARVSRTLLDFWMPESVADAYDFAAKNMPLSAIHVAALVNWFTRGELDSEAFSGVATKLDFETLVTFIKRYCMEQGCAGQPLTAPELINALHLAIA